MTAKANLSVSATCVILNSVIKIEPLQKIYDSTVLDLTMKSKYPQPLQYTMRSSTLILHFVTEFSNFSIASGG